MHQRASCNLRREQSDGDRKQEQQERVVPVERRRSRKQRRSTGPANDQGDDQPGGRGARHSAQQCIDGDLPDEQPGDLLIFGPDSMHDFDRRTMCVERAARRQHDCRGTRQRNEQYQPQREQRQATERLQQRLEAGSVGNESSAGYGLFDRSLDLGSVGPGPKIDVDDRRHRQIGFARRRAKPAFQRSAEILRRDLLDPGDSGIFRAAAIAAGAFAAPSLIWIE